MDRSDLIWNSPGKYYCTNSNPASDPYYEMMKKGDEEHKKLLMKLKNTKIYYQVFSIQKSMGSIKSISPESPAFLSFKEAAGYLNLKKIPVSEKEKHFTILMIENNLLFYPVHDNNQNEALTGPSKNTRIKIDDSGKGFKWNIIEI